MVMVKMVDIVKAVEVVVDLCHQLHRDIVNFIVKAKYHMLPHSLVEVLMDMVESTSQQFKMHSNPVTITLTDSDRVVPDMVTHSRTVVIIMFMEEMILVTGTKTPIKVMQLLRQK